MNIVLGSSFRNSAGRTIEVYFRRVQALQKILSSDTTLRLALVEGDSVDHTAEHLAIAAINIQIPFQLIRRNHGGPVYGSTEQPERMRALSYVGNGFFEAVQISDDYVVYVESDLIWEPDVILRLIQQISPGVIDVVSPLVFAGEAFYDIWAFRKNGVRFEPFTPYHSELNLDGLTEVDSTGSCMVMHTAVARETRMTDNAFVSFGEQARAKGYKIWVDSKERIYHP